MAAIDAEIRSYFATPVVVFGVPEAAGVNATLKQLVLEREKTSPGVDHSNLGGWQSADDFETWGGDAGGHLISCAKNVIGRLTSDRTGKPVAIDWKLNAWANINRTGHANEFHTHPGAYWSVSYYVDDGYALGAGPETLGGEFEIQDPRGIAPAMYAPMLAFALDGGQSVGASELIPPKTGNMLVFPSWLSHGVRPYLGHAVRISIAMNFSL